MAEAIASGLVKGVLGQLTSSALQQIALWWNLRDDVEELRRTVSTINAVLLDAEEKSVTSNGVKNWLENLKDVLYEADDLLDAFSTEALRQDLMWGNKLTKKVRIFFSSSNQFAYGLKMGRQIKAIKEKLNSLKSQIEMLNLVERDRPSETPFMAKRREQGHSFVTKGEIIGREDDKNALLELILIESEENLLIIPIVGMGGLGKTALAQLVYNDDSVKNHFELRMWVCVSDVFDVKTIVENIIKSATGNVPDQNLEMDQLQQQLRDKIDGKRYLLVLDDIWNEETEKWFSLKKLLIGGARGSRIIVTTRSHRVAKITSASSAHVLKGLADDDAWNLFKHIAFEQRPADPKNPTFVEIGKKVVEKCKGVPLVIRTIAGTLSYKETEKEWLSFEDNELARVSQQEGDIMPTLKLSYDHLPSPLKHCFAYCRLYPKDSEIHVLTMIQLWVAQGFVEHSTNPKQSVDDIGFGYFNELVERSFFQVEEYSVEPTLKMSCKMHDLMHDLAESVAGAESTILDSNSRPNVVSTGKCRHVSVDFSLIPSHEISIPFFRAKNLRTLMRCWNGRLQNISHKICKSVISSFRCLRALELRNLNLNKVPTSIHKLKHLRYLDLSHNPTLQTLPNSICKMYNLRMLKLNFCSKLKRLPKNIEKLVSLNHLILDDCDALSYMPCGIGKLTSLETLSLFVVDKGSSHGGADLSELSGLHNLRGRLTIKNLGYVKNAKTKFQSLKLKEKALQKLRFEWSGDDDDKDSDKSLEDLQPHPNLKKLHLIGWRGDAKFPSWFSSLSCLVDIRIEGPSEFKHLPTFHELPYLEELWVSELSELEYMDHNLSADDQGGSDWESELFFPSLKHLYLVNCPNLKSWWKNLDDENATTTRTFPHLSSLRIEDCPLTSMPLYPSLEEGLILRNCSSRPLLQTMQEVTTRNRISSSVPLCKLKSFDVGDLEGLDVHLLNQCLQSLTSLRSLSISFWMKSLLGSLQQLTGLKSLALTDTEDEEFDLDGMQLEALRNVSDLKFYNMTRMVSLPSWLQHLIGLKNLSIRNCNRLTSLFPVFAHLTSLQSLRINGCEELELFAPDSQIFQDSMSLRYLDLVDIPKCQHLPGWLQQLTNLQQLYLARLPNPRLPDEARRLMTNYKVSQHLSLYFSRMREGLA